MRAYDLNRKIAIKNMKMKYNVKLGLNLIQVIHMPSMSFKLNK